MATTSTAYGLLGTSLCSGSVDWVNDTIRVALLDDTYTFDQDTHQYRNHLSGELTDLSYTPALVTGMSISYNPTTNVTTLDCNDVTFTELTATDLRYAVWYSDTGTASTSPLICCWDFNVNLNPDTNDVRLTINSAGLVTLTIAA